MSQAEPTKNRRRAVIDPGMAAALREKDVTKEAAVKHSRHWVRLTRICNQRCLFCLDSFNQNGTYHDTKQLIDYIELGARLGRERLVLSGGEGSIHPDFIKLIRAGRKAGYDWIQTISNGAMFAYPEFTRRCIQAGLDEVTISVHGHTSELHDRLVGVPGAHKKAISAIRNIQALSGGRTVVNVDVVINKQNVRHIRTIIDGFRAMGIHEFDLLYIVPFGRGYDEHREELFFDLSEHFDDLQRAFEVSKEPGVYIWTNRLPAEYLEGYEHLIQDPHKLATEVQGGLSNYEAFLKLGTVLDCYGDRCQHCFLQGLCHDHLFDYRQRLSDGAFPRVRIDLDVPVAGDRAAKALELQRPQVLHVQAGTSAAVTEYLADHPYRSEPGPEIFAEARDEPGPAELLGHPDVARVVVRGVPALAAVLEHDPEESRALVEVVLDAETAPRLVAESEGAAAKWLAAGRIVGRLPNREFVSEVRADALDPDRLSALRALGVRLKNVAPCLGGEEPGEHIEIARHLLDADGNLEVFAFVDRYVLGEYYKKSMRCHDCRFADECRGMHINFLRAYGFACLQPIAAEAPDAETSGAGL